MTNTEQEFFYSLFEDLPNISILYIFNGTSAVEKLVENVSIKNNGKLTLKNYTQIDINKFHLPHRTYEYIVTFNILNNIENSTKFIETLYHALENSGYIINIEDKSNNLLSTSIDYLNIADFRGVNPIDITDKYDIIMGKKLHMWGNGQ